MQRFTSSVFLAVVALVLLSKSDAWWLIGKNGNNDLCRWTSGTSSYYFGTTDLPGGSSSSGKGRKKRSYPSRGIWEMTHRFIYYKGFYFEFFDDSTARISNRHVCPSCPGSFENSPAGYSEVSVSCIKGCARNYRCTFGTYNFLDNNCHHFANELSKVLCTRISCPAWCLGNCNHAYERIYH